MLTFQGKPITNIGKFNDDESSENKRFITALLIEEHGITPVRLGSEISGYEIKSVIFKKGGFGNVVLHRSARPAGVKQNQFTSLTPSALPTDSIKAQNQLNSRYNLSINGAVRWTGNDSDAEQIDFAHFDSFTDFVSYMKQRFGLTASSMDRKTISAKLQSYVGQIAGYSNTVLGIMGNVKDVNF